MDKLIRSKEVPVEIKQHIRKAAKYYRLAKASGKVVKTWLKSNVDDHDIMAKVNLGLELDAYAEIVEEGIGTCNSLIRFFETGETK